MFLNDHDDNLSKIKIKEADFGVDDFVFFSKSLKLFKSRVDERYGGADHRK